MFDSRTQRRKKKLRKKTYKKAEELSGSQLAIAFRRFRKNKAGVLGLFLVFVVVFMAIFAEFLAPYDPDAAFLLDYPGYSPSYQPPGERVGGLRFDLYTNLLTDSSFESNLTLFWSLNGWQRINLTGEGVPGGTGSYAVRSPTIGGELTQDISSNEDLFYMDLMFDVYIEGNVNSTLSVIFTYDNKDNDQLDLSIQGNSSWQSFDLELLYEYGLQVRQPEEIIFTKSDAGSPIIIDHVDLRGGEYFKNIHLLGTNYKSQDLWSRLVYGAQVSLLVSFGAILISLAIGIPMGLMAGYYRGKADEIIMRATDVFMTMPFYFVMILAIIVIQNTQWIDNLLIEMGLSTSVILVAVMVGLGIFGWMGITRLIRASIFQIRETDYVEAARAIGASNRRIMVVHILPNVLAPLIVVATLALSANILVEAGLAFLGFTTEDLASWGRELSNGFDYATVAWWSVFFPAFIIVIAVMAFNLFGDGLRDAFDPRLR
ncbi:MAG: ABC transporter permease [Candidatus Hodarchaeales archaeon]|jgi:peptide/nickel transport system permease protein